jgi:hypothetical protein
MADELDIMATYIYQRLTANATITGIVGSGANARVYQDVAPQGATFPYIVYASLAPKDIRAVGAIRIASSDQWLVKAYDKTSAYNGNVQTLSDAIDDQLHGDSGLSGVVSGGSVIHSYRIRPWRQAEVDNGVNYRSRGGIYALMAQVT